MGDILNDEIKDIREIKIDESKTIAERKESFLQQIKDPYHFKYKDIIVSLDFVGEDSLEDKLIGFLKSKIN